MFRQDGPKRYYGEPPPQQGKWLLRLLLLLLIVIGSASLLWLGWEQLPSVTLLLNTPVPATNAPFDPTPTTKEPSLVATEILSAQSSPVVPADVGGLCPAKCAELNQYLLEIVNQDRQAQGLASLSAYQPATQAAQAHAQDMLRRGYFSHVTPEGTDFAQRLAVANADPMRRGGENIWKYRSGSINGQLLPIDDWPALVLEAETSWMNSPGHRGNILNADFTHLGVGIAYDSATGEVRMVQVFFTPAQ